jgi:hypothetical protein
VQRAAMIIVVDILHRELEGKLPYWLSPLGNPSPKLLARRDAIRKKNRDAWLTAMR